MALEITSLRVNERVTSDGNIWGANVPYLIVNSTFKITGDEVLLERTKAEASEYRSVLTIDDIERYEGFLANWDLNFSIRYDGYGRAWTHQDPAFYYIEKFQTFWFRQWIADSAITRAVIAELEHYRKHGELPTVYRHDESYIITSHFNVLDRYWD